MHPDQARWDERYRNTKTIGKPAGVLEHYQHLLPKQGSALDLACGLGGNALLLAQNGLETHAWDISAVGIQTLAEQALHSSLFVQTKIRDITAQPPEPESFDVIVVSYFLERSIFPALIKALKPNGLIFYQTFTRQQFSDSGPSNPAYRLQLNELRELLSGLQVVDYLEGELPWLDEPVDEACIVAKR